MQIMVNGVMRTMTARLERRRTGITARQQRIVKRQSRAKVRPDLMDRAVQCRVAGIVDDGIGPLNRRDRRFLWGK